MDMDTSWRRKRPAEEDEDYLASKRYISEKFFNMRISHPDMPGLHGAGSAWQGSADKAAGIGGEVAEATGSSMSDEDVPDAPAPLKPTAAAVAAATAANGNATFTSTTSLDESDVLSDSDSDNAGGGPAGAAGGPPTPHPFLRSASSAADEKLDDWVRTTRHRMLADASVNSAPDLCRALILYKPVGPTALSTASNAATTEGEEGGEGGGEGGGDPTPSPQAGGDGGGEIAPPSSSAAGARLGGTRSGAEQGGLRGSEQSAGSSTAEAAGFTGGGGRTEQPHGFNNGHPNGGNQRVAGSLFAPRPRGLCTARAGGDAAGGARVMQDSSSSGQMLLAREESVDMMQMRSDSDAGRAAAAVSADAMEMDAAVDEAVGGTGSGGGSWEMAAPEPPMLTRVGTSRGAPTPELTPERAEWARAANQRRSQGHSLDPNEVAGGPSARPALTPQTWARW